jgi:prevent-host-death family protein
MSRTMTSRQFNQDTSGAKRAAEHGPVVITDRGHPTHVLLTYREYERVMGSDRLLELLGEPAGVADVELTLTRSTEVARSADLD